MKLAHIAAIALASILPTGAFAQDAYSSGYSAISPFEGVYAGAYTGGQLAPTLAPSLGGIAGANFSVTDNVIVGAEVQGGANFAATTTFDALMLGRAGYEINDQVMVYGAAGGGAINGAGSYAIGGGAEAMVTEQIGVRGEVLGTGQWGGGLNGAKANIGALWHLR